jgi:ketosteroid isomerase-like protein
MLAFISRLTIVAASILVSYPATARAAESPAAIQDTGPAADNRAAVEAMLRAWMAGDSGALQSLLANDIEWTITGHSAAAGTTRGRAELMSKVLGPFGARFAQSSDRFRPRRIHGVYTDSDTVIVHFDGAGVANDGQAYSNSYLWLLTLRDGKIARGTAFFDSIAFDKLWNRVQPAQN